MMRVTVQSQDLIDALKSSAVARSTTLPMLTHALLRTEGSELVVEATDLVARTVIAIPAEIHEPGEALLPADRLAGAADGGQAVTIDHAGKVTRGRSRFALQALPPQDFPREEGIAFTAITIDPAALQSAISEAAYAADEASPRLPCRGVGLAEGFVSATNGYQAVRIAIDYAGPRVMIPVRQIPRLQGLLHDGASVEVANVRDGRAGLFRVRSGSHVASIVCIEVDAYDFSPQLGAVDFGGTSITLKRKEFLSAVRRFKPFVVTYSKGDSGIVLTREGERLSITDGFDPNNIEDVTDLVTAANGDFRVGLHHTYLGELLGALESDLIEYYPSAASINLFLPEGGDVRRVGHVVMPQAVK